MEEEQYLGTELVDKIEEGVSFMAGLPGIKQTLGFVGGAVKMVDEYAIDPLRYASEIGEVSPEAALGTIIRAGEGIIDMATKGGGIIAESAGVDPRIGQFVGGTAAETLLTAGAGTVGRKVVKAVDMLTPPGGGMALAATTAGPNVTFNSGSVNLKPTVNKLTVDDPRLVAPGVGQGTWREFEDQLKRMDIRWAQSEKRLKRWVEAVDDPRRMKNIKKSRDALKGKASTGPSRIENVADENWYTKDNKDFVDVINQTPQLGLERHHMFPKAESYIFVEHMRDLIRRGIADRDDMVNLFLYAEDAGAVMGNRKANMLLMEKIKQHGPHHRMRETTEGALGLVMEPANLQNLADVIKTANNATELMSLFDEYLIKNIKPSKQDAFNRVMGQSKAVLNETLNQKRMRSALTEAQRRRL